MKIENIVIGLMMALTMWSCKNEDSSALLAENQEEENNLVSITQAQFDSSAFKIGKPTFEIFQEEIRVFGKSHLPEKQKFVVTSLMDGVVGSIDLIEGERVKKGQVLFSVLNPELINMQEEYLVLQARLPLLTEEALRQEDLAKENLTSRKDVLTSKLQLSEAATKIAAFETKFSLFGIQKDKISRENLSSRIYLRSPMNGYISAINVHQGLYMQATIPAMVVAGTDDLHLELTVLEKDAHKVKHGQKVVFYIQNNMEKPFYANVDVIKSEVNEEHMVEVHCDILDNSGVLAGMYVIADIDLGDYNLASLPESALVKVGDEQYILKMVSKEGKALEFEKILVKSLKSGNGKVAIEGLDMEGQYLIEGAYFML